MYDSRFVYKNSPTPLFTVILTFCGTTYSLGKYKVFPPQPLLTECHYIFHQFRNSQLAPYDSSTFVRCKLSEFDSSCLTYF